MSRQPHVAGFVTRGNARHRADQPSPPAWERTSLRPGWTRLRIAAPVALAATVLLGAPEPGKATQDVPSDARLAYRLSALPVIDSTNTLAPNTNDGWDVDNSVAGIEYAFRVVYDPSVGSVLTIENTTGAPLPIQMEVQASMEPQFADAPLHATAIITLSDGTSEDDPDGSASFVRSDSQDALARGFVQAFDGQVRSFGFFETPLFPEDLLAPGTHQDEASGLIAFDAAEVFFPSWNEMVLTLEGTLSPGDSIEFDGRFDVNVVPEPARLAGQAVALLTLGGLARRLRRRG